MIKYTKIKIDEGPISKEIQFEVEKFKIGHLRI